MMIGQLGWEKIELTGLSNIWQLCLSAHVSSFECSKSTFCPWLQYCIISKLCYHCMCYVAVQGSKNCKKELSYGDSQNVDIVPVMAQRDWKATQWLGILTAGLLWIDFR